MIYNEGGVHGVYDHVTPCDCKGNILKVGDTVDKKYGHQKGTYFIINIKGDMIAIEGCEGFHHAADFVLKIS